VFFVNVPLAGIVALAALAVIPRDPPRQSRRSFDLSGALTVTAGVTLLVYVLVQGPETGWDAAPIVAAAVFSALLLAVFVLIETRSADPLMPMRLFRNRSLVAGMSITFIYMGSFGALPYFLTVLFQTVMGFSALETGLAFIVPSLAIAVGTQLGERLATKLTTRSTLLLGSVIGVVGTVAIGLATTAGYAALVPGLVVSGIGQGIVWTGMWIASASGVAAEEQGVASGMASTTLNIGNAIGLAILIVIANAGIDGQQGEALRLVVADGTRLAFILAVLGIVLGGLVALALPRRTRGAAMQAA